MGQIATQNIGEFVRELEYSWLLSSKNQGVEYHLHIDGRIIPIDKRPDQIEEVFRIAEHYGLVDTLLYLVAKKSELGNNVVGFKPRNGESESQIAYLSDVIEYKG